MPDLESYREQRDTLLIKISETLSKDNRFVAAWITGSIARNESDSLSDIDITLVVSDAYSASLCHRPEQVSAQTPPERYALFSQFGTPTLIHENNNNAPAGGTFTFVLYASSALMVDWTLTPQNQALRPIQSRLLFEKISIPLAPLPEPEDLERSKKSVNEQWAFFWMMSAITIKYILRDDAVFVTQWLENLHRIKQDVERRLNREPWIYKRGSSSTLQGSREQQIQAVRELCDQMLKLKPQVTEFVGSEPATPLAELEQLLSLAESHH